MTPPEHPHDRIPTLQPPENNHRPRVAGNERLTALAGTFLLALIVAEVATIPNIRALMSMQSSSASYWPGRSPSRPPAPAGGSSATTPTTPAYRRKGPPRLPQRTTAPLLLLATLVVIASGIGLATTQPGTLSPLYITHKVSFLAWTVLLGIHLLGYLPRLPGLLASDWLRYRPQDAPGRRYRLAINLAALAAAAIAAILILPAFTPWTHLNRWTHR